MKKVIVVFYFILGYLNAQQKTIDSLKIELKNAIHDTTKCDILNKLIEIEKDDNKWPKYNNILLKIAQKNSSQPTPLKNVYLKHLIYALGNTGYDFKNKGDIKKALEYYNKALDVAIQIQNKDGIAYCLNGIGIIHQVNGDVKQAIEYFYKGLKINEEVGDKKAIASSLNNLANIYLMQGDVKKAKEYYYKNLSIKEEIGDKGAITFALKNLGFFYSKQGELNKALEYYFKSLKLEEELGDKSGAAITLNNIGSVYTKQNELDKALECHIKSLNIMQEIDNKGGIANSFVNIGKVYNKQKKYQNAIKYAQKSFIISKEIGAPERIQKAADLLYNAYKRIGNHSEALKYYEEYIAMRDSLNNDEVTKKAIQSSLQYDFEKKELKNKLEQQQKLTKIQIENERKNTLKNIFLLIAIFIVTIGGIVGYVLYRNNKQKQAIREFEKNELKQKLLVSQMNPHFIFNSVDHIQSLIGKKDEDAKMYLHRFAKLTRQILEYSRESHISLEEEKQVIENYISIQQLLYENNFTYELTIANDIETEAYLIPPMLTQPFIENAIKHGLKDKTEIGKISIHFYVQNKKLFVEIKDNGTGFIEKEVSLHRQAQQPNSLSSSNHKSLAMKITKERLGDFANNIIMENVINEHSEIQGAKINFEIPYIYEK